MGAALNAGRHPICKLIYACILFVRRHTLWTNTWSMFTCEPKPLVSQTGGYADTAITIESDEEEAPPTKKRFVVVAIASVVFFVQVITYILSN